MGNSRYRFRAWNSTSETMVYPADGVDMNKNLTSGEILSRWSEEYVMQWTGLTDKNGKEVFEGDIIRYYDTDRHVQQSHPDINPEIDEVVIRANIDEVVFFKGCFTAKKETCEENFYPIPIELLGFGSIEDIRQCIFNDETLSAEEMETDCNGFEITETVVGFEVIGNIYESPELLNK